MRMKKTLAVMGAAALMTVAACGGGDDGGDDGGDGGNGGTDNSQSGLAGKDKDPTLEGPAAIPDGATEGGTVYAISALGMQTMDPTEAYFTNTSSILSGLMTRSLTQYVYDGEGNMVLVPDLATDLGTPNKDFTKWTFEIREGAKWENGDPVTVEQIANGIDRSFGNRSDSTFPNGAGYSVQYFKNGDKYYGPYDKRSKTDTCECYTIKGNSITIDMASPFPDMPYWGAFPAMGPIADSEMAKDANTKQYAAHPLSTGPYKLDGDIQDGNNFTLVRNDQWDADTDPGRTQLPDGYDFKTDYNEPAIVDQTVLGDQGQGTTTLTFDNISSPNMREAQDSGRLVSGTNPCTFMIYMDMRDKAKWGDKRVRQAFNYAYPTKAALVARGSTIGVTRYPATTILPPGIPGRKVFDIYGTKGLNPNPSKSRELLKAAGKLNMEVSFLYPTDDPLRVAEKDAIVQGLKKAGFNPQPVAVPTSDKVTEMTQDPNTDVDFRQLGWCSDWPSGSSWFPPVFSATGSSNYSYLKDAALDKQMDKIQTMPLNKQPAAWADMDEHIMKDIVPIALNSYGGVAMAHGSAIEGMNNDNVFGMPTWKNIWVQQ